MKAKPNLFAYGTSELSQDAFICWLFRWGDSKFNNSHKLLHDVSVNFIKYIFKKHNKKIPEAIESIDVKRQVEGLDVLIIVNETIAILIEDKTFTKNHSDQLRRYLSKIEEKDLYEQLLPIYFKIGNQSDYSSVKEAGYEVVTRSEILSLLSEGINRGVESDIFRDYYDYLVEINENYKSYESRLISKWTWLGWQGFYTEIQKYIDGNWGYVANANGGFLGCWWNFHDLEDHKLHLQLEQKVKDGKSYGELCFKIAVPEKEKRPCLRNNWYKRIVHNSVKYQLETVKPTSFGNGHTMTVAILRDDYRRTDHEGIIDLDETVKLLRKVEKFVYELMENSENLQA
ncbi:PD-(D/E)XK nuclease family protein [Oceanobacillus salinisoli]|uniref:PD-(D/E)XK nuclease family protein n=1 Tax=Oceanobacillus salinisoli TaxID=2678611 RepID=UPI0012E209F9|nr:PD-(D/E)XK nuclease family protein [Oceanobacillus salinisoli]